MNSDVWRGRVALVTGASSGIGMAVAQRLGAMGMRVAVTARRADRLDELVQELSRGAGEALAVVADARIPEDIANVFDAIRSTWGGVDVLVNSAGLGRVAPLLDGDSNAWREMLEVNVLGLSVFTREGIEDMRRRGDDGYVIHISSMSGHRVPSGAGGMYSATKHAVRALTEALRRELRAVESGIRVSSISPGFVETEFAEVMTGDPALAQKAYSRFPCLQPNEIADQVIHLLSQAPHVEVHDVLMRPLRQPT